MTPARADDSSVTREYQVKAAMLFNFAQFVEWPAEAFESPQSPVVIGVVGANPFGEVLEQIVAGKTIAGRGVVVRSYSSADAVGAPQVLFIPAAAGEQQTAAVLKKVGGRPVLSVGETDGFPWAGGIIRFYNDSNKVRFEVNPDAAAAARITISAKLMKLGRVFKK